MASTDPYLVISTTSDNRTPTVHEGGANITEARRVAYNLIEPLCEYARLRGQTMAFETVCRHEMVIGYTLTNWDDPAAPVTTILVARNMMNRGPVDENE